MYAMQSHVLVGQYTKLHLMTYFHQLRRVESLPDKQLVDGPNVEALRTFQVQLTQLIIQFVQRQIVRLSLMLRLAPTTIAPSVAVISHPPTKQNPGLYHS